MSAWFSTKLFGFRVAGYDVLRVILGLLVLVAAGLKGYQLGTGPVAESGLLTSRWFLSVVVESELSWLSVCWWELGAIPSGWARSLVSPFSLASPATRRFQVTPPAAVSVRSRCHPLILPALISVP